MSETIAEAQKRVLLGNGKERVLVWGTSLKTAIDTPGFLERHSNDIVALLLEVLPSYTGRAQQEAVNQLVRAAVQHEAFLKPLAAAIIKQAAVKPVPQTSFVLLEWSSFVVGELQPDSAQKAVRKLLEAQGSLLDSILYGQRHWKAASRVMRRLLRRNPALIPECLQVAAAGGSPGLIKAALEAAGGTPSQAEVSQALLPILCDKVIGGRERPSADTLAAFAPLLTRLSSEEFMSVLLPALNRALRRTPEPAMAALAGCLPGLTLDLSPCAPELMSLLVQQVRAKEALREVGLAAVGAAAARVRDPAVLQQLVVQVTSLLDGSAEGKVKLAGERSALTAALAALGQAPGEVAASAAAASSFCCSYYKEETVEDVKLGLLSALALWLPRCSSLPPEVPAAAAAGLGEAKESLRRCWLKVLVASCRTAPHLAACLGPVAAPISRILSEAAAKPVMRGEGALALLVAAQLAAADEAAGATLAKAGLFKASAAADSPLLTASALGKLAAPEAAAAADAIKVLLLSHAHRLQSVPELAAALALLLLHQEGEVRSAAAKAAAACVLAAPAALMAPLVEGLHHWMNNTAAATVLVESSECVSPAPGTYSFAFSSALLQAVPPSHPGLRCEEVAALALAAHHPAITRGVAARDRTWLRVVAKLRALRPAVADHADSIVSQLVGPAGLRSSCEADRTAASLALGSCMAAAPGPVFEALLPALELLLDRCEHDALSEEALTMWRTPEGILSSEVVPEGVYVPQVVASKNVRKARGRMRSENRAFASLDDEEEEEEEEVAPPPPPSRSTAAAAGGRGAKAGRGGAAGRGGRGAKNASSRQQEFRERKLAEEAEVRGRVNAIKAGLQVGLAALRDVVEGNTRFAAHQLAHLSPLCLPLLGSQVVGVAAFAAVRALARCMPPPLNGASLLLGACLRLVVLAGSGQEGISYDTIPEAAAVEAVMSALVASTVAVKRPLPGPSYALVFPVLEAVLHCRHHTPLQDDALSVLALHVRPEQDIPRGPSLVLLYHLLGIIPAYRERVQPLLASLCSGVMDSELNAAASGLLAASSFVRAAALAALPSVPSLAEGAAPPDDILVLLQLACHDVHDANAEAAQQMWEQVGCQVPVGYVPLLAVHLASLHTDIRAAAATALAAGMVVHPASISPGLNACIALYTDPAQEQQEQQQQQQEQQAANGSAAGGRGSFDGGGKVLAGWVEEDEASKLAQAQAQELLAARRCGSALGLRAIAPVLSPADVEQALHFLISQGLADNDDTVRALMVAAGAAIVDATGQAMSATMLPLFEGFLEPSRRSGRDEGAYDLVREGVVVLLGTLAGHMEQKDDKRRSVVEVLLEVLVTPSEAVQRAVSNCLPPLMTSLAEDQVYVEALLARLMEGLRSGATYGDRRGAAFGLAGVVKGLGISSLRSYGVLDSLKMAVEDKRDARPREGALLAFECLCEKLGRLFEPYIIHILPLLLQCFGDPSPQVRAAASDAARLIMGQLSASGVKLVLPALLKGLEDPAWRTKQGSIQLLGSMAYCAPRQLSTCLPRIVPPLSLVLSDPHPKVQAAAREALTEVGSVIRSPEMAALVPVLLAAISDPNNSTRDCLDTLLDTTFINTIDAASLALLVPVVHRGLRDRSGDTKKRAARIVGNMCSLTQEPKDMAPYVPLLMPELQKALLDPLPEVRAIAARAMGSLQKGMGSAGGLGELLPWLMATLRSEGSSVERSGAGQGLAEVLAVQGEAYLASLLPELLANARHKNAFVREGQLTLFRYLPLMMEESFQEHLGEVLPVILDGLSDEAEGVRDAALEAGRVFVDVYATTCLALLLPAVEAGLNSGNWRIRQASVELLGELLFKVAGTSGKVKLDGGSDDEGVACETYGAAILEALGHERRDEVLGRLYLVRTDVQYAVRNGALHVWKTLVVNTPKTLQEILPALMAEVIAALADEGEDRRLAAARCLGELVRKMGERVLHRIIPMLQQHMGDDSAATRQGVCSGLKELLENVTRHQLTEHLAQILPAVQGALCDADPAVREAAGSAFGVLFKGGAGSAVDSVVPSLMAGLDTPAHYEASIEGLRVILSVRPTVFNSMAPKLLRAPVSSTSLRALGQLAPAAASVLAHHLPAILATMLPLSSQGEEQEPRAKVAEAAALAVAVAAGEEGLPLLVAEVLKSFEETGGAGRALGAAKLVKEYAGSKKVELSEVVDDLIKALVPLLAEEQSALVLAAWSALDAVTATIPKEEQARHVGAVKEAVATAREKERRKRKGGALRVAGFCDPPKALSPVLPIYLQGVLQGSSAEVREAAAEGLGELVELTSEEGLKPFTVAITGPLIRIIGDRFPGSIKAAILFTLGRLINKAGPGLKPFVPQLQTTFLKCLNDPTPQVRSAAADNLGQLTRLSARVEALVADLAANAASAPDPDIGVAYLTALKGGLAAAGERLTPPTLDKVAAALNTMRSSPGSAAGSDSWRAALAAATGAYAHWASPESLGQVVATATSGAGKLEEREGAAMLLAAVAKCAGARLEEAGLLRGAVEAGVKCSRDEALAVKVAGGRAVCRLYLVAPGSLGSVLVNTLTSLLGPDQHSEVARHTLMLCLRLLGEDEACLTPHLPQLLPCICAILQRDPSSQVKAVAEQVLKRALGLAAGDAALDEAKGVVAATGGTARSYLTDAYLRRLLKMPEDSWLDAEEY